MFPHNLYWCVTALHIAHLRYPCLCSVSECYNIIMCPMWQERKCAKHIDQWSENAVPLYFHVTETKQDWDKFSSFSVISTTLHKHLCLRHDFVQTSLTLITDCEVKQQPLPSDITCYLTMFVSLCADKVAIQHTWDSSLRLRGSRAGLLASLFTSWGNSVTLYKLRTTDWRKELLLLSPLRGTRRKLQLAESQAPAPAVSEVFKTHPH